MFLPETKFTIHPSRPRIPGPAESCWRGRGHPHFLLPLRPTSPPTGVRQSTQRCPSFPGAVVLVYSTGTTTPSPSVLGLQHCYYWCLSCLLRLSFILCISSLSFMWTWGWLVGVFYWCELRGSYSITGRFLWDERLSLDSF